MLSYPQYAKRQEIVRKNVQYWTVNADLVIPGMMGVDGIGRWDILAPSVLSLDLELWSKSVKVQRSDGVNGVVNIVHAPNHRGFKGSEFIEQVIEKLTKKGLRINYILLENMQNEDCPLTGFCGDENLLEPIRDFMKKPCRYTSFYELIEDCLDNWIKGYKADIEHWEGFDCIKEEILSNDYQFTDDGDLF